MKTLLEEIFELLEEEPDLSDQEIRFFAEEVADRDISDREWRSIRKQYFEMY